MASRCAPRSIPSCRGRPHRAGRGSCEIRRSARLPRRRRAARAGRRVARKLSEIKALSDIAPWRLAVVLESTDQGARIGFQPAASRVVVSGRSASSERSHSMACAGRSRKWSGAWPRSDQDLAGLGSRRRDLCRSDRRQGGPVSLAAGARRIRRHCRDRAAHRPRARNGRWVLVRSKPVQSRNAGAAATRLVVQAVRHARRSTTATRRRVSCSMRRSRSTPARALAAGER